MLRQFSSRTDSRLCYHKDSTRVCVSRMSSADETCDLKEKVQYQSWGGIVTASNSNNNQLWFVIVLIIRYRYTF